MKNIKQILLIEFIITIAFCSCGKSGGDKFIGNWQKQNGAKLIITATGETAYTLKTIGPTDEYGVAFSNTNTSTYQDGNLISGGNVICSYSNNNIIFNGDEY